MEMASETTQNSALRTDEAASHGPLWRLIDCAVTAHANRAKVPVNRKAYLRWCLLGVFGAQRFYAKQWKMGLLYLVTCWSGFSIAMTNDRRNDRRADETGRKRHHLPVKTSSLRRPAGCCLPAGLAVDSEKQRMLAKFQGSTCTICRKVAIAFGYYFRQNCFPFPRRHVKLEAVKSHFLTPIRHTRKATRHGPDRSAVVQP